MVAEGWIYWKRSQVGSTLERAPGGGFSAANAMKKESKPPPEPDPSGKEKNNNNCLGILSLEVASAMSKAVQLYRSLTHAEVGHLRGEVVKSHGVRTLVAADEARLLELVVAEKLDDLGRVAAVVARLGKRCGDPALAGFEHVYADLLRGRVETAKLGLLAKDMDRAVRKMERLVSSTAILYGELEVLNELEQGAKKLQLGQQLEGTRRAYEQKIQSQRHDVRHLSDVSLWNLTYDKAVGLLARAVCTIHARLRLVFGAAAVLAPSSSSSCCAPEAATNWQLSGPISAARRRLPASGPLPPADGTPQSKSKPVTAVAKRRQAGSATNGAFPCGASPARLITECLSITSSSAHEDDDGGGGDCGFETESCVTGSVPFSGDPRRHRCRKASSGRSPFAPKNGVAMQAAPTTVGGAALALHYANVIIILEKLLRYPHLVGEEARDDLYRMLPTSLRSCLRRSLRPYAEELAIYDAPVAQDWKEKLEKTMAWLAPMAHNMIRWQTERNFEQRQIGPRANVLLVQTLFFADRERTEAAMCELLVGLNYICRYEQQQSALLDCSSSLDFEECVDWQL